MTIETKYNIGDEVLFQTLGINYKAEITHISIDTFARGSMNALALVKSP